MNNNPFKNNVNKKRLRIISLICLLIISLGLVFNAPIKRALINSYHPEITRKSISESEKKKAQYNYESVKKLTLAQIANAKAHSKKVSIVGQIAIPSIGINLPIGKGINNTTLALAAGTFRPDMKMGEGNYALAGHNMSNLGPKLLFSPLYYKAKSGQKVYVTDLKKVYVYKITQKEFVSKYRVDLVQDTPQKMITLITCDATGANRLMVRGKYIKAFSYHHAPQNIRKYFADKYNK